MVAIGHWGQWLMRCKTPEQRRELLIEYAKSRPQLVKYVPIIPRLSDAKVDEILRQARLGAAEL